MCIRLILFIFGAASVISFQPKYGDYCDEKLCNLWNGTDYILYPHIGCNNNGILSPTCPKGAKMLKMVKRRRDVILSLHNEFRNTVASGKLGGYKSAVKMHELKWDEELEYLASLNVKRCIFDHDLCRNTERFPYSGQNLELSWQIPAFHSNTKRLVFAVTSWAKEHSDANMSFIDEFKFHSDPKINIGHFTMLVSDGAKRVGCAAIRYPFQIIGRAFLMACNYDYVPIFGKPVYVSGEGASQCRLQSTQYPALCEWKEGEDINQNNEIKTNFIENV